MDTQDLMKIPFRETMLAATGALVLLFTLPFVTTVLAQTSAERGLQIMQAQEASDAGWQSARVSGTMVLYDASKRAIERSFVVLRAERNTAEEGDLSLILFRDPADVRGTVLLTHSKVEPADDDQWLYLPVNRRVRRIASSNRTGKFLSSEFSYEDMGGSELEDNTYEWLEDAPCPGAADLPCHLVAAYPKSRASGYSKRLMWLDTKEYRPYQSEYYNRGGHLEKRLTLSGYNSYQGHWRPDLMQMENLQTGRRTDMRWDDYRFGIQLSASDFSPQRLGR